MEDIVRKDMSSLKINCVRTKTEAKQTASI